jgi:hypothetical protein
MCSGEKRSLGAEEERVRGENHETTQLKKRD